MSWQLAILPLSVNYVLPTVCNTGNTQVHLSWLIKKVFVALHVIPFQVSYPVWDYNTFWQGSKLAKGFLCSDLSS